MGNLPDIAAFPQEPISLTLSMFIFPRFTKSNDPQCNIPFFAGQEGDLS
jgi:hypothetical protein